METKEIQERIEKLNQACVECQESFKKDGFEFSTSMCKYCSTGAELHRLETMNSESEKMWDKLDWTSSKLKEYYKG